MGQLNQVMEGEISSIKSFAAQKRVVAQKIQEKQHRKEQIKHDILAGQKQSDLLEQELRQALDKHQNLMQNAYDLQVSINSIRE